MSYPTDQDFEEARRDRRPPASRPHSFVGVGSLDCSMCHRSRDHEIHAQDRMGGGNAALLGNYRDALIECVEILEMPNNSALTDVPDVLRRLKKRGWTFGP